MKKVKCPRGRVKFSDLSEKDKQAVRNLLDFKRRYKKSLNK